MAERRRRKRLKWYGGGAVLVFLALYLGDPYGWFQPGQGAPTRPGAGEREPATKLPGGDPTAKIAPPTAKIARVPPPDEKSTAPPPESPPAAVDRLLGLIDRLERAITRERLAEVATLVDQLRTKPPSVPEELRTRWQKLRTQADDVLACGGRLRKLIKRGEVLAVSDLLGPLRSEKTPEWLTADLDAAAAGFGWPALTRGWQVRKPAGSTAALPRHREVRFRQDGKVQVGKVWRSWDDLTTIRVAGAGGFTYPVVKRADVQPIAPTADEAFNQGLASAHKGDELTVLLWACHLHERGNLQQAKQLRALLE